MYSEIHLTLQNLSSTMNVGYLYKERFLCFEENAGKKSRTAQRSAKIAARLFQTLRLSISVSLLSLTIL